ncbi:endo-1,4-beta-xylanase [Cellulomonas composti]|uniref:Beta-xylanase n=1 Tax=Cellulomonas composti TaxID=266130 RepID=A0A511J5X3_9CELL|nr:endo-1,4-beta-xylanase [Cellulomonas composti]GEL93397.1 beta-xylanase [Cellulomonas composti]
MTLTHRVREVVLTVRGPDGTPLTGRDVVVEQRRHEFGFGCIGFDFVGHEGSEADARLAEQWFDLFDTATLPFYWRYFEPEQGHPDTDRLLAAARWFVARGARVKGHTLMWHTLAPQWLLERGPDEVERLQRERITRDVGDFAGVVDTWDAINEVVIMPVFTAEENAITPLARARGRVETVRLAFETARAANPDATLLINDFDLSPAYEQLVEEVLEAGIRVDAIGLQTHMHQGYVGEEKTQRVLDRFARFGLPLHLTETTLVSGDLMPPHIEDLNDWVVDMWPSTAEGEQRQADEIVRHYRTLLAHPAVQSATYWGLTDAGAWLGAPAGLVRADGTPKPAYDALRDLVRGQWWHGPTTLRTDDAGRVRVTGWRGDYAVRAGAASGSFVVGTPDEVDVRLAP